MDEGKVEHSPLAWLYDTFSTYIEDRRRNPKGDILTKLAAATFPDGSTPEPLDVARVAANLFAAGQETTVRLLSYAFQVVGERPDLQQLLREFSAAFRAEPQRASGLRALLAPGPSEPHDLGYLMFGLVLVCEDSPK